MFSPADTIVAIATPPGRGGIGVVRVSGPEAHRIGQELTGREQSFKPRYATFVTVRLPPSRPEGASASHAGAFGGGGKADTTSDHGIVTYFPTPASYTGDDVVEISAHGSPVVLTAIVTAAIDAGAPLPAPAELPI